MSYETLRQIRQTEEKYKNGIEWIAQGKDQTEA